jgi:ABC-type nickel/cobalt efflux system permease component RcnA
MLTLLVIGFLLGMRHALESDHVAAVATLAVEARGWRQGAVLGALWGLGHTLVLLLATAVVLFFFRGMMPAIAFDFELLVGVMLVVLGLDVLRRMRTRRVHLHTHRHADGTVHAHLHAHDEGDAPHEHAHRRADGRPPAHEHGHDAFSLLRALVVGGVHGLAGSAAIMIIGLEQAAGSPWRGLLTVALFGLGSILGMAAFSLAVAVPARAARGVAWLSGGINAAAGVASIGFGLWVLYSHW